MIRNLLFLLVLVLPATAAAQALDFEVGVKSVLGAQTAKPAGIFQRFAPYAAVRGNYEISSETFGSQIWVLPEVMISLERGSTLAGHARVQLLLDSPRVTPFVDARYRFGADAGAFEIRFGIRFGISPGGSELQETEE